MQNSQRCFLQLGTDPVSRAGSVPYGATSEKLATALWETQDMSLAASRFGEEGHAEREKRFSQIGIATWNEVSGCHSLTINANHIGGWPIFVGYFVFTVFSPVELGFLGSDLFCNFGPHGSAGHTFPGFKRWILVRNGITAETLAQSTLNETSQFEICSRKRFELVDPLRFGLFMMWRLLQRVENLAWMMEQYWICSDCPNRKCYNKWPSEGWQQRYGLDYVNQSVFFDAFWCVLTIRCLQCTPSYHCHFRCLSGKTSTTHRFAPLLLRCRCTYRSNTLATTRIVAANPWRDSTARICCHECTMAPQLLHHEWSPGIRLFFQQEVEIPESPELLLHFDASLLFDGEDEELLFLTLWNHLWLKKTGKWLIQGHQNWSVLLGSSLILFRVRFGSLRVTW